eukprot:TRINITY_DN87_c0_g2_i1.p2 TRINITY_DN87_c0_g2~~TRINITY_DN87_c0_g2_i1.p2  ORF type:complete len:105 (-),score=14.12 TRINITY_DN87_c0_g2_i1:299-613(-)
MAILLLLSLLFVLCVLVRFSLVVVAFLHAASCCCSLGPFSPTCSPLTHGSSWRSPSVVLFPVVSLQQVGWDEAQVVFCHLFLFAFSLFFVVVSFCPKVEHRRRR